MAKSDYSDFLNVGIELARVAGGIIREAFYSGSLPTIESKDDRDVDLVTATDKYVEALLREKFKAEFPSYKFIGEESSASSEGSSLTQEPTIIVDPIDGTTNFIHRFPFVCVSIGLVVDKIPVVGVIFNPILDELYTAHINRGAYMNGSRLPLFRKNEPLPSLSHCLISTEAGNDRTSTGFDPKSRTLSKLMTDINARGLRCAGAGAIDCCLLARGSTDVYYEIGVRAWDISAGVCIIRESGGMCFGEEVFSQRRSGENTVSFDEPFDLMGRKIVAIRFAPKENQELIRRQLADIIEDIIVPRD